MARKRIKLKEFVAETENRTAVDDDAVWCGVVKCDGIAMAYDSHT